MQYLAALREGQRRVAKARDYLSALTNSDALPALALHDTTTTSWEPVGIESHYSFISDAPGFVMSDKNGFILALVDDTGTSKAILQNITPEQKESLIHAFDDDGVTEFKGKVILPM